MLFRTAQREEKDVADGRAVGQEHDQAVNANAQAACRRQAVFQSTAVVFIHLMRFVIAAFPFFHLFDEAVALVDGVIQFRETVCQLTAVDKGFETISQERIIAVLFGERRNFQGMTGDDGRLDEVRRIFQRKR